MSRSSMAAATGSSKISHTAPFPGKTLGDADRPARLRLAPSCPLDNCRRTYGASTIASGNATCRKPRTDGRVAIVSIAGY